MTGQEFLKFHSDTLDKMKTVCAEKNNDYAGGNGAQDAFANFRLVEMFGAASSEQGFFTRMTDKMSRISTFIQKGILLVKDESVEDTLIDLANYCIFFAGFLRSKRMGIAKAPTEGVGQLR